MIDYSSVSDVCLLTSDQARNFGTLLSSLVAVIAAIVGFLSLKHVYRTYEKSAMDKSTDVAIKLEETYRVELATMLACEYVPDYNRLFLPALVKANLTTQNQMVEGCKVGTPVESYSEQESLAINQLESMLRYYHFALSVSDANTSLSKLIQHHAYYLGLFTRDCDERADLRDYIERHWPEVFNWGLRLQSQVEVRYHGCLSDPLAVHWEEIAKRAFEIYIARLVDGKQGSEVDDWNAAESQLREGVERMLASTQTHRAALRQELARRRDGRVTVR